MTITIDATLLASYYAAKSGVSNVTSASTSKTALTAATPPWTTGTTAAPMSDLVKSVLAGGKYIDPTASSTLGTTTNTAPDVKNLFALYQGLTALEGVAQQAETTTNSSGTQAQLQKSFATGLSQLSTFLAGDPFQNATVVQGNVAASIQSTVGVKAETDAYTGQPLITGTLNDPVPALQGDVQFSLSLNNALTHNTKTVNFDLSEMGSTPRTVSNLVVYMNGKLAAAGVQTRFKNVATPVPATTITANGTTTTLPASGASTYSLGLVGVSTETATFSAPDATPAVYVASASGTGTATTQQLTKFDGDASASGDSRVFGRTLPSYVSAVRSTATGPDGSLYVLADVTGTTSDGQTGNGSTDVALLKYDSAGALTFTRTLGSSDAASGYALAVSADGSKVAVAGTVTGDLDKANPAPTTSGGATQADTFVTEFDSEGVEQWTQRRGATGGDDTPSAVTFGTDGSVYVTGKTTAAEPGTTSKGGQDAYLLGFNKSGTPTLTTQFGTSSSDKGVGVVATATGVTVASVENGHAVLRQFTLPASGAATASTVRDLGDLQGGDIAGLTQAADGSLIVAGSTHNGALAAGTVTNAYDGGRDVFVAKLSADLTPASSEALTYYDAGDDASTSAVTVSGGQVYVAGQVSGPAAAGSTTPTLTGYAVAIDPTTGQASWSQSLGGANAQSAPTSIAVAAQGTSTLDKLGLPTGKIDYTATSDLAANTSLRPGDQFKIKVGTAAPTTVTIAQGETIDTLIQKINRASGFQVTASALTVGGYRQIKLAPANARASVQILAGPDGQDALGPLGLFEGTITSTATASSTPVAKGVGQNATYTVAKPYALNVPSTLSVDNATDAKRAEGLISAALLIVRKAYTDLSGTGAASTASTSSSVPAYLTAQIANYQLALARLTGASS